MRRRKATRRAGRRVTRRAGRRRATHGTELLQDRAREDHNQRGCDLRRRLDSPAQKQCSPGFALMASRHRSMVSSLEPKLLDSLVNRFRSQCLGLGLVSCGWIVR